MQVLAGAPESMRLLIEETEPSYANALRRVLVSDVPKMAIEDVEFHLGPIRAEDGKEYESVSPLFDEMIAHRLGLVPIPTDLGLYNRREDCPKWQATHGVGYRYYPILKAGSKALDALDPAVPFCESHMQSTAIEEEETLELSSDCKTCKKFIDLYKVESVKAGNDPTRIVMEFETDGSLSTKAVLVAALDILSKRFSELATQASGLA